MRLSILVLSIIGIASAVPLQGQNMLAKWQSNDAATRNSVIEQAVLELIERLRELMLNGSDTFPVIDPYERDSLYIDGEIVGAPGSHLALTDIRATGGSSFSVDHLSITLTSLILQWYRAEFRISIPVVTASVGNYDLDAEVFGSHYYGNGEASLEVRNVKFAGHLDLGTRIDSGIFLTINYCHVTFNLDELKVHLTGVFGSDATSQYISEWLEQMIPYLLDVFEDIVTFYVSLAVFTFGNWFLEDFNIGDLLTREIKV